MIPDNLRAELASGIEAWCPDDPEAEPDVYTPAEVRAMLMESLLDQSWDLHIRRGGLEISLGSFQPCELTLGAVYLKDLIPELIQHEGNLMKQVDSITLGAAADELEGYVRQIRKAIADRGADLGGFTIRGDD